MLKVTLLSSFLLSALSIPGLAVTVTLNPTDDSYIMEAYPDHNWGNFSEAYAGSGAGG